MKKIIIIFVLCSLVSILIVSCEGDGTGPALVNNYRVEAILYKEILSGNSHIDMILKKNGDYYNLATVTLDGVQLDTMFYTYSRSFGSAIMPDSSYTLSIVDSTFLNINLTITIPATFAINSPALRTYTGDAISVEWTLSDNNDGYILATAPPDSALTEEGYEIYVVGTTGTIPPGTFEYNPNNRIPGTHKIFAVAYAGAPPIFNTLPFDIPTANSPADNIDLNRVVGRVAGLLIAPPDSVIVVSQ